VEIEIRGRRRRRRRREESEQERRNFVDMTGLVTDCTIRSRSVPEIGSTTQRAVVRGCGRR
jgi:hypothetical protein